VSPWWEDATELGVGVSTGSAGSAGGGEAPTPHTPRVGSVHALAAFVAALASADADGRILVEAADHPGCSGGGGGGGGGGDDGGRIKFVLLDAAARFKQVVGEARAVVLVGGRGLHSSTFQLIISAFCGIRWVVHGVLVTNAA